MFAAVSSIGSSRMAAFFRARVGNEVIHTRSVLLATGVVNNRPKMTDADHRVALATGLLRYCPICDGFEVTDKRVGVIGHGTHGFNEAVFLRMYTDDVTLVAPEASLGLSPSEHERLNELGIATYDGPLRGAGDTR